MKLMVEYLLDFERDTMYITSDITMEADDLLQTNDEMGSLTMADPLTTVHYATVQIWSH